MGLPLVALGAVLFACGDSDEPSARNVGGERWEKVRAEYTAFSDAVPESVARLAAPLARLDEEQKASVAGLLLAARIATLGEASATPVGRALSERFWTEMSKLLPPTPSSAETVHRSCLEESIAYASAMARCRSQDRSDDECERRAAPEAAAEMQCKLEQMKKLGGVIGGLPGSPTPPGPFPWPVEGGATGSSP